MAKDKVYINSNEVKRAESKGGSWFVPVYNNFSGIFYSASILPDMPVFTARVICLFKIKYK